MRTVVVGQSQCLTKGTSAEHEPLMPRGLNKARSFAVLELCRGVIFVYYYKGNQMWHQGLGVMGYQCLCEWQC